jgi:hypothetical protein
VPGGAGPVAGKDARAAGARVTHQGGEGPLHMQTRKSCDEGQVVEESDRLSPGMVERVLSIFTLRGLFFLGSLSGAHL